ncbi:MAG: SagB/ThcOx family dehydrogenase [Candidatus Omnitrophica bacterium]|nr:SagB/ThcOx family dehydrogenase [Candidatus Omnitrophota bacterium]
MSYQAYGEMDIIELPRPKLKGKVSLEEAISSRRSVRSYSERELTMNDISQLLWASQGITDEKGLRAAPSAGALYPLEIYIAKKDGIFYYLTDRHRLKKISGKDKRSDLARAAWNQRYIGEAPIDIVICAVYKRVMSRYGERGIRYTDIEVGHSAENVHLEAVALGLSSVPVGAFDDKEVSGVLGLPEEETPVYIIPVGYRK